MLIACEDVTERRRAEEAVRESAKRSRALIEHAFDAVVLVDQDLSILYASPSVGRVLGYEPMEIVGRSGLDFIHPDHVDDARNRMNESRSGSSYAAERLFRHKNGNWLWLESAITNLLGEPSVRAFVVNLRDIDARKRAQDALRESEHRFRDYAETASDWFWETGPDHRFTEVSYQAPFPASGLGMTRWDVAADLDEDPQKWLDHRAALDAHRPFRGFAYKVIRPDGTVTDISASGKPLFDPEGRFLGYRGVATDVSDKVRADNAERALQETRMALAHVARITSLGELTASIAHELNQPLTAVIMNAGTASRWLNADPPDIVEARQTLASIAKDGRRASDVIGRIRALAKKKRS